MKTIVLFASALLSNAVLAGPQTFAHPDAEAVVLMGSGIATICAFNRDFPTPAWACYERTLQGEQEPRVISLPTPGPVTVSGAKWAYVQVPCNDGAVNLEQEDDGPGRKGHRPPPKPNCPTSGIISLCGGWEPMVAYQE